ncbi:unnamed protein product [Prorocentrum cordatum]|uniref:Uncharacterized protein n=1 Tax=Prorocentrum cordatum TaxID=2364126 RepID=A0ABN9QFG1_9DINO|nr:unnamed protein product [Polarella glacialis]
MSGKQRYHSAFPHPKPAKEIYSSRPTGSGWPEQCPPIKAAQAFGWDVINPLDIEFVYGEDGWEIAEVTEVDGDDLRVRSGVKPHDQDRGGVGHPDAAVCPTRSPRTCIPRSGTR